MRWIGSGVNVMEQDRRFNSDGGDGMPTGLAGMLREMGEVDGGVTESVDDAVLGAARRIGKRRRVTRRVVRGGGAVAVIALVGMGVWFGTGGGASYSADDVNRDGVVDMLDARAVAVLVRDGAAGLSEVDVQRVAGVAVSLDDGAASAQTLGVAR